MKELIKKTREYLDYIEEHYNNVQKSFEILKEKCAGKNLLHEGDDYKWYTLCRNVELHDKSKLSSFEFQAYRAKFFPTEYEKENDKGLIKQLFNEAWEHHKSYNHHHWENWILIDKDNIHVDLFIIENVCDWMAMGMKFGDTAKSYYEKNKERIAIPKGAENYMYEIFDCIY